MTRRPGAPETERERWRREAAKAKRERWERLLDTHIEVMKLPLPVKEHRFYAEKGRQWRFDRAWPAVKLAVEVEGLVYQGGGGRHQRPAGFTADVEKYNAAALDGWMVLRFTPPQIIRGEAVRTIRAALKARGLES